jgi:hypothetical protein
MAARIKCSDDVYRLARNTTGFAIYNHENVEPVFLISDENGWEELALFAMKRMRDNYTEKKQRVQTYVTCM